MVDVKVTLLMPGYGVAAMQPSDNPDLAVGGLADLEAIAKLPWLDGQVQMPWQAQLCCLLGLSEETGETLPAAQFSGYQLAADRAIVCAAPIHLKADRDTASLIPPQQLGLRDAEADDLIASLNDFLQDDGIEIFRDIEFGWFIVGMDGQELKSFPPAFLAHRSASAFLPSGENSGHWRRLMTEIQMLLHTHPVNALRESQGKLPVNSLWFWGGALLADPVLAARPGSTSLETHVYALDSFSSLLCSRMGIECDPLSAFDALICVGDHENLSSTQPRNTSIVVVDTTLIDAWLAGDESAASAAKTTIESRWIEPLVKQVEQGRFTELEILTEDGEHALYNTAIIKELDRQHAAAHPSWWRRVLARCR